MYLRYYEWQDVLRLVSDTQDGWENQFRLDYPCVDIRFKLTGYGWKPNSDDENIPILYQGVYKCYYRKVGDTEWTYFSQAWVDRAPTDDSRVYAPVGVQTGKLEEGFYEVKIVATRGEKYESWGGAIEGITKSGKFWYELQMRSAQPIQVQAIDEVFASDWSYGGKEVIELGIYENVSASDIMSYIAIGFLIQAVDDQWVGVAEWVNFFTETYQLIFEVITISEYINLFNPIIGLVQYQTVNIVEDVEFYWSALNMYSPVQVINIVDEIVTMYKFNVLQPSEHDSISVQEYVEMQNTVFSIPLLWEGIYGVQEYVSFFMFWILSPQLFEFIYTSEWVAVEYTERYVSRYDNVNVDETAIVEIAVEANAYDQVVVSENIAMMLVIYFDVYDTVSANEYANILDLIIEMSAYEDIVINEFEALFIGLNLSPAAENISVAESVDMMLIININVNDNINIVEYGNIHDIVIELGVVYEQVSIVESVIIAGQYIYMDVYDTVAIIESVISTIVGTINVYDTVSVVEYIQILDLVLDTLVYDSVAISESIVMVRNVIEMSISDNVSVTEWADIGSGICNVNVVEYIAIAELANQGRSVLSIEDYRTALLCHFDGSDGWQIAPDESAYRNPYTFVDDGGYKFELDTAQYALGVSSLLCPGITAYLPYLKYTMHPNWGIRDGDFYIQLRWRRNGAWEASKVYNFIVATGGTAGWRVYLTVGADINDVYIFLYADTWQTSPFMGVKLGAAYRTVDAWHSFAISRNGLQVACFYDGRRDTTYVLDNGNLGYGQNIYIGASPTGGQAWKGWIDEVYIVAGEGVRKWDDGFYIPDATIEYSDPKPIRDKLSWVDVVEVPVIYLVNERDIIAMEWINVVEDIDISNPIIYESVYEAISIAEWTYWLGLPIAIRYSYEDISIVESAEVFNLKINRYDTVSVNEYATWAYDAYNTQQQENLAIAEWIDLVVGSTRHITPYDTVTIGDNWMHFPWDSDCSSLTSGYPWYSSASSGCTVEINPAGQIHLLVPSTETGFTENASIRAEWIAGRNSNENIWFEEDFTFEFYTIFNQGAGGGGDTNSYRAFQWSLKNKYRSVSIIWVQNGNMIIGESPYSIVQSAWQTGVWVTWRFEIKMPSDGSLATVVIYKDDVFIAEVSAITTLQSSASDRDGDIQFYAWRGNAATSPTEGKEAHIDWVRLTKRPERWDELERGKFDNIAIVENVTMVRV